MLQIMMAAALLAPVGCLSPKVKDPVTGKKLPGHIQWAVDYKKARALQSQDANEACAIFTKLAGEKDFPARPLAELRKLETCTELQSVELNREQFPPWLKDMALDVMLNRAITSGDKVAELELAVEKSTQNLPQTEKVKWIERAIELATEFKQDERVSELQQRLYKIAPRLNPQPKVRDFLKVASDYRIARQFTKAREYYRKVIKSSHFKIEEKIAAYKGIRLSYKNARQREAHIKACWDLVRYLRQARKANPRSRMIRYYSYDAEIYYGRAIWTAHRAGEARKIFENVERQFRGKLPLGELYWLMGRMAEERGDYDAVSAYFEKALKEKIRDSELQDRILWYSAWNERRRGNLEKAATLLSDLESRTQAEYVRVRALYWLGKTYQQLNKENEAKTAFERLADLDPLGYYGLLAHRNLSLAISFRPSRTVASGPLNIPMDTALAEWLSLLEEPEALTALLDSAAQEYRKHPNQNDDGWFALFQYYAKAGLYMKLYQRLGSLAPERRKSLLESHPELLFPQPWSEEVKTAALQFGVEEELLYAIMRQESAFDPRARSVADAFGLMQILPEVAETLGAAHNIPYTDMHDLYDPKVNVMIGAAHIKELLNKYKGQFILAVASYNANESAIRNWMKTRYRGDALEFIEEIPYEETRTYVRLVMRNLIFYSLLKSKNASIEFPSWVLKLEDAS